MKKILFLIALSTVGIGIFAQISLKKGPLYTNYYRIPEAIQTDEIQISFENVVSKSTYTKFKVKFTNKTSDFIIVKGNEIVFNINSHEAKPDEKPMIIKPYDSDYKVLDVKGSFEHLVDTFYVELKGISRFSATGKPESASNFILPPSVMAFETAKFTCSMVSIKKETWETNVKFDCRYRGNQIGLINTNNAMIKLENGQEYATAKPISKPYILFPGENEKFSAMYVIPKNIVDMQYANMQIVWKSTFSESTENNLSFNKIMFVIDPGLTVGKNK